VFNPPHIGHLVCAQEAWWQLELDEVLLMPVGEAPHRPVEHDPGGEERFELCRLAAGGAEWLTASRAEVDRDGPSYTVDTLAELRAERPQADLYFVLGADQALRLPEWHEPARVLELATLAIAERDGVPIEDVEAAVTRAGPARMERFVMPRLDVSSTEVRGRVAAGQPYRFLVPEPVADRIERVGLYR
jgi:nicotinate-nucleotide adenylyltransferase